VPTSVDESENFVTAEVAPEVGHRACALYKSVSAVNGTVVLHLSGSLRFKFGEDRLKIEGARDYRHDCTEFDAIRAS